MNKVKLLRAVNTLLFTSFIVQAATGIIMAFRIRVPHMQTLFEVHEYNGFLLAALVLAHLMLNFGWIKANFFTKRSA